MYSLFLFSVTSCVYVLAIFGIASLIFTTLSGVVIFFWGEKLASVVTAKKAVKFTSYVTIWCFVVAACLKYIFLG
jgi:hypothetical protein